MFRKLYEDLGNLKARSQAIEDKLDGLDKKMKDMLDLHEEVIFRKADQTELSMLKRSWIAINTVIFAFIGYIIFGR